MQSDNRISILARKCCSLNFVCTGCLGPYRSTFSTIWGTDMLSNTVREPLVFSYGRSCSEHRLCIFRKSWVFDLLISCLQGQRTRNQMLGHQDSFTELCFLPRLCCNLVSQSIIFILVFFSSCFNSQHSDFRAVQSCVVELNGFRCLMFFPSFLTDC